MPKKWYVGVDAQRGLPSGYTELAYIQSSGTQYINTGFVPNNNTKAICDAELLSGSNDISVPFGTYESGSNRFALMYHHQLGWTHWVGGASGQCAGEQLGRHTFTLTGTSLVVDSATKTFTTAAFTGSVPMFIFGINYTGYLDYAASMRLYSCKIYDNGTLVRDFVPCKNASNVVGLYDLKNGVFYSNAGTGTFTAGSTVTVGGVAREVKKPYIGVSNVARKVKKGYVGVDNVARLFFQSGIPIGSLPVGQSIWLNENGVPTEFFIVHQGNPNTSVYDASCTGTWLLRKKRFRIVQADCGKAVAKGNYSYEQWGVHSYLTNTYINKFDEGIRNIVKTAKIPYYYYLREYDKYTEENVMRYYAWKQGADGLPVKFFLPSLDEFANYKKYHPTVDYATLDYFLDVTSSQGQIKFHADVSDGSSGNSYIFRMVTISQSDGVDNVSSQNSNSYASGDLASHASAGIRPMCIVPQETLVNPSTFEILA